MHLANLCPIILFIDDPAQLVVLGLRDRPRLEMIFSRYRPEFVFHKHVPLMEQNVEEAVTNLVLRPKACPECNRRKVSK